MSERWPSFKALYVVSDIHMGGRKDENRNFQIFRRGERLGALIRSFVSGDEASVDLPWEKWVYPGFPTLKL